MNCQLRGGQSNRSVTGNSGTYLLSDSVPCTHSPGAGTLAISARCLLRRRARMQEVFPHALTDPPALGHWPSPAHSFIHSQGAAGGALGVGSGASVAASEALHDERVEWVQRRVSTRIVADGQDIMCCCSRRCRASRCASTGGLGQRWPRRPAPHARGAAPIGGGPIDGAYMDSDGPAASLGHVRRAVSVNHLSNTD